MNDTKAAVGTTLEVLAPYLPYGIEVGTPDGRGKLLGLPLAPLSNRIIADVRLLAYPDTPMGGYGLRDVLPVLRPFSALCESLEDGTVPAIEAAKISGSTDFFRQDYAAKFVDHGPMGRAAVVMHGYGDDARAIFWIYENKMAMIASWPCIVSDAWRYLRFHHFAVGLEPHQYISK